MTVTIKIGIPSCEIKAVEEIEGQIIVKAQSIVNTALCPECRQSSNRVHSYYTRCLADLPLGDVALILYIQVRRFRCLNTACQRQTFVQPLCTLTSRYARRTTRLTTILWHIGQVVGGQAASRLSQHLKIPTTRHSIIRMLRQSEKLRDEPIRVLGVDDWAKKRGQTYGTILVNLETHRVVDLLPDRQAETLATWLRDHPSIEIVARDRSTEYANGIATGAPQALQVADRWHLLKNVSEMVQRSIREQWPTIRQQHETGSDDAMSRRAPFPRARDDIEKQRLSRERRMRDYTRVQYLKQQGYSQRRVARVLDLSRAKVRIFWKAETYPERSKPVRPSILDPHIEYMTTRVQSGDITIKQLWCELVERGYPGQVSQVRKWVQLFNQSAQPPQVVPIQRSLPSRDTCVRLLTMSSDKLSNSELHLLHQLLNIDVLNTLHYLTHTFTEMIRQRQSAKFDQWLQDCVTSGIRACKRFAESLFQDYSAVHAALSLDWNNGQTEGQVHRLKLLKRQMYGRAKLDLLRIRICYQP